MDMFDDPLTPDEAAELQERLEQAERTRIALAQAEADRWGTHDHSGT